MVFRIEGFQCRTQLVDPPLLELTGHRTQQAVEPRLSERGPWWSAIASAAGSSGIFHPEFQPLSEAVGGLAGDTWDYMLPEASERRRRNSQRTCRLPSRCAIPDWTEFHLPSEFGSWQSVRLKSGRSGGCWKDERHTVSMSTGRWSELSAELEVRYTWNGRYFTITISKTSEVAEGFYGWWLGCPVQRIFTGLPANVTWMAVASKWVSTGTGTE